MRTVWQQPSGLKVGGPGEFDLQKVGKGSAPLRYPKYSSAVDFERPKETGSNTYSQKGAGTADGEENRHASDIQSSRSLEHRVASLEIRMQDLEVLLNRLSCVLIRAPSYPCTDSVHTSNTPADTVQGPLRHPSHEYDRIERHIALVLSEPSEPPHCNRGSLGSSSLSVAPGSEIEKLSEMPPLSRFTFRMSASAREEGLCRTEDMQHSFQDLLAILRTECFEWRRVEEHIKDTEQAVRGLHVLVSSLKHAHDQRHSLLLANGDTGNDPLRTLLCKSMDGPLGSAQSKQKDSELTSSATSPHVLPSKFSFSDTESERNYDDASD